jgi:hypothetical protein
MAQAYDPYEKTDEVVKERCKPNGLTVRIEGERVEKDAVRKVMGQVLYQPHMVIGIFVLKPDPGAGEDVMIRKIGTQKQGKAKDEGKRHAVYNSS